MLDMIGVSLEEERENEAQATCEKIISKNIPELMKDANSQIQKTQLSPRKIYKKINCHLNVSLRNDLKNQLMKMSNFLQRNNSKKRS